ncbi:MAG: serine/threonine-protein kinase [Planctomycetota bacterium]
MVLASCPTDDELRGTLTTSESDARDEHLQSHLDGCERCQTRLEQMARQLIDDETVRDALSTNPASSSNLLDAIDQLSAKAKLLGSSETPRYDDLESWIETSSPEGGETLDGYLLRECIGRGGMGVVFRAVDPGGGGEVAVKAMLPELARDPRARDRFLREARAVAAVRHRNVVALHAVSEVDGLPYLVTEYVEGESLQDRMQDAKPFPPAEIKRIGSAVATGLAACHAQGVIHRDVKPSNVLLGTASGTVKITDFGLAAVASTPTITYHGYLSGTPDYIAPERLMIGTEADERSDLFSLGCLLYTMATGKEPFGGDSPLVTLHRIATDQPPSVREKNPDIPPLLAKTIASLMAKRPEDRPVSANAVQAMLSGEQANHGTKVRRLGGWLVGLAVAALAIGVFATLDAAKNPHDQTIERPSISSPKVIVTTGAELEAAVDAVVDGGWIEIDTDEPIAVAPLYIDHRSVTIAATQGRTPTIELKHISDEPTPAYLLRVYNGKLNLIGLRLQDAWDLDKHLQQADEHPIVAEQFSLLSIIDADLEAVGCRFETSTVGACVKLDSGHEAILRNCDLFAPNGTAINLQAIDDDELTVDQSVLVGNVGILTELEGNAEINLSRSVVLANIAALELNPVSGQLAGRVSDCVIQSVEDTLILTQIDPPSLSQFKSTLAWFGSRNRIRGTQIHLSPGEHSPTWDQEVTAWAVSDEGSVYGRELFGPSHQEVVERLTDGESAKEMLLERDAP